MNAVTPIGAPTAAEKLRRCVTTIERINAGLRRVVDCDENHGALHLDKMEAEAASVRAMVASLDPGLTATIEAALRPAGRQQIAEMAAALVGCFPNADKRELAVFGAALPREIGDLEPSTGAVAVAFKIMVTRARFLPSISEVLAAVEASQAALVAATEQIPRLEEQLAQMEKRLQRLRDRAHEYRTWCERRRQA